MSRRTCSKQLNINRKVSISKKYRVSITEICYEHSIWSEWHDLNVRPLPPQGSALPTAPHPDLLSSAFADFGIIAHCLDKVNRIFQIFFKNLKKFQKRRAKNDISWVIFDVIIQTSQKHPFFWSIFSNYCAFWRKFDQKNVKFNALQNQKDVV